MTTLPYTSDPLIFWMDPAEKFVTRDSGNRVSAVVNRVDGNIITQFDPAKQPAWNPAAINGLPGLVFSGAQGLNYDYIAQLLTNKQPFTITQIFNNFTGNGVFVFIGYYGTTIGYTSIESQGSGMFVDYEDNAAAWYRHSDYITLGTGINVVSSIFDGTTLRARLNGKELQIINVGAAAPGAATFTEMNIGFATVNNVEILHINCSMGEIIIYKGPNIFITTEAYLKEKYSLRF